MFLYIIHFDRSSLMSLSILVTYRHVIAFSLLDLIRLFLQRPFKRQCLFIFSSKVITWAVVSCLVDVVVALFAKWGDFVLSRSRHAHHCLTCLLIGRNVILHATDLQRPKVWTNFERNRPVWGLILVLNPFCVYGSFWCSCVLWSAPLAIHCLYSDLLNLIIEVWDCTSFPIN